MWVQQNINVWQNYDLIIFEIVLVSLNVYNVILLVLLQLYL